MSSPNTGPTALDASATRTLLSDGPASAMLFLLWLFLLVSCDMAG